MIPAWIMTKRSKQQKIAYRSSRQKRVLGPLRRAYHKVEGSTTVWFAAQNFHGKGRSSGKDKKRSAPWCSLPLRGRSKWVDEWVATCFTPVDFFLLFKLQTPVTLCSGELWSILVVRLAHSADLRSRLRHESMAPSVAYSRWCSPVISAYLRTHVGLVPVHCPSMHILRGDPWSTYCSLQSKYTSSGAVSDGTMPHDP